MLNQTLRETLDRPNFITNSDWRAFQAQPFKTSFQWMSDSIKIENLNWALAQDHRLEWSNLIGLFDRCSETKILLMMCDPVKR